MSEPDELAAHIERAARQMVTNLVEERDELRAERDRLRAVADAARMALGVINSTTPGQMLAGIEGHDEVTLLRLRLDQLDGSAEPADG